MPGMTSASRALRRRCRTSDAQSDSDMTYAPAPGIAPGMPAPSIRQPFAEVIVFRRCGEKTIEYPGEKIR